MPFILLSTTIFLIEENAFFKMKFTYLLKRGGLAKLSERDRSHHDIQENSLVKTQELSLMSAFLIKWHTAKYS